MIKRSVYFIVFSIIFLSLSSIGFTSETENDRAALRQNFFGSEDEFSYKQRLAVHYALEHFWALGSPKSNEYAEENFKALEITGREREDFLSQKEMIFSMVSEAHKEARSNFIHP